MINNPDIVSFCNTQLRPFADSIARTYYLAQTMADLMASKGIPDIVALASGEIVVDGSPADGRTQMVGQDIINIYNVAQWIVYNTAIKDGGIVKTQVLKVAVNP